MPKDILLTIACVYRRLCQGHSLGGAAPKLSFSIEYNDNGQILYVSDHIYMVRNVYIYLTIVIIFNGETELGRSSSKGMSLAQPPAHTSNSQPNAFGHGPISSSQTY